MIIKSIGRKAGGAAVQGGRRASPFAHLTRYMNRGIGEGEGKAVLWHNFYCGEQSREEDVVAVFEGNAALLGERRNGNVLYHEILSFSAGHQLHGGDLVRCVADIGQEYLNRRATGQLAYGVVHLDTEHVHLHLMISANPAGKPERVRLPKRSFARAQQDTERFVLERYPQLAQTRVYDRTRQRERAERTAPEPAMAVSVDAPSRNEAVRQTMQRVFGQASTPGELASLCKDEGIAFYRRGKTVGIVVTEPDGTERKHRLATLGMLERYEGMLRRFSEREMGERHIRNTQAAQREHELRATHSEARRRDELYESPKPHEPHDEQDSRRPTASGILLPGDDILFQYLNMNAKQAKELSLPGFLGRLGYVPARNR